MVIFRSLKNTPKLKIMKAIADKFICNNPHINKTVFVGIGTCPSKTAGTFTPEQILQVYKRPESILKTASINIDRRTSIKELPWVFAHELGHFYDWACCSYEPNSLERFADNFAADLLNK